MSFKSSSRTILPLAVMITLLKSYGRFRVATSIESKTTSSSDMVTMPFELNSMMS